MNNIQNVGNVVVKNQPVPEVETQQSNVRRINFKAENDRFVRQGQPRYSQPAILQQQPQQDPLVRMMEKQEKEEKKKNFWNKVALFTSILAGLAIIGSFVLSRKPNAATSELKKAMEACDIPALKRAAMDEYAKGPHMRSEKKIKDILALAEVSALKPGEIDLRKAIDLLDEKIVDMPEVKSQVTDFLIDQAYNARKGIKNKKPLVLCLDGPAGTGKTSVSEVIAEALGMPYKKISMGGTTGTSIIRGTESKFVGSEAGGIAKGQIENKSNRVLYCLDEIDKLGKSEQHGSAESALLSLFDDQAKFADDFLGAEIDISNSVFVLTTNDVNKLSTPLKNRLRIMTIAPYGLDTKTKIAKMHFDKLLKENKIDDIVTIKEDTYAQLAKMTDDQGGRKTVANAKDLVGKIRHMDQLGELQNGEKLVIDADFVKKTLTFDPKNNYTPTRVKKAIAEGRMKSSKPETEAVKDNITETATVDAEKTKK